MQFSLEIPLEQPKTQEITTNTHLQNRGGSPVEITEGENKIGFILHAGGDAVFRANSPRTLKIKALQEEAIIVFTEELY